MIGILVGPSGAGKSTLGAWAQEDLGLHWLEADIWATDGIDRHRLRGQWNAFYEDGNPRRLANTLRLRGRKHGSSGTLLTLPSPVILSPQHATAADQIGIAVVVVWGPAESCLAAFLARERGEPRGLGENHWRYFNETCFAEYAKEAYAPFRVNTFNEDGTRRGRPTIMKELAARRR